MLGRGPKPFVYWFRATFGVYIFIGLSVLLVTQFGFAAHREYSLCHRIHSDDLAKAVEIEKSICSVITVRKTLSASDVERLCGQRHQLKLHTTPESAGYACVTDLLYPSSYSAMYDAFIERCGGIFFANVLIMAWVYFLYFILGSTQKGLVDAMYDRYKMYKINKMKKREHEMANELYQGLPDSQVTAEVTDRRFIEYAATRENIRDIHQRSPAITYR